MMLLMCVCCTTSLIAQDDEMLTVDIDSVRVRGFGGVNSIFDKNANQVVSHYIYFNNGASLEVAFLSLELEVTKRVPLPLATGDIQPAVYNGETLMFYTLDKGNAQYYTLSTDGEILGQFASQYNFDEEGKTMPDVIPSEIDGMYYIIRPWRKDPGVFGAFVGYEINKVDSKFASQWTKSFFPSKKKEGILMTKAESGFDRLVIIESNMANWLTNKMTGTEMVCFDGENGDELYRVSLYDDDFTSLPSQIIIDMDGNISLGGEYFKGNKTKNTSSEGIFVTKLDPSGQELAQNRSTWSDGIQKQMKRDNFSLSGKNKVLFHDLIASEDGGFQLIGESFSKKQTLGEGSALGMAANLAARAAGLDADKADKISQAIDLKNVIIALATGRFIGDPFVRHDVINLFAADNVTTPTILTVQEMLVFDYDESLELTNVNRVEKAYTKVYSYPPYTGVGGLRLAKIMRGYGFFDYAFASSDPGSGKQIMVYNSMMSKEPHIGVVDIEKGSQAVPKQFIIKNLKKYGGFDEEAESAEVDAEASESTDESAEAVEETAEDKKKKLKFSNAGVARANDGKVLIYYIEKEKRSSTGTLKIFHETISEM